MSDEAVQAARFAVEWDERGRLVDDEARIQRDAPLVARALLAREAEIQKIRESVIDECRYAVDAALEKALERIRRTPSMPFPDPGAHSWPAYANAVHRAWTEIQRVASAALSQASDGREVK